MTLCNFVLFYFVYSSKWHFQTFRDRIKILKGNEFGYLEEIKDRKDSGTVSPETYLDTDTLKEDKINS